MNPDFTGVPKESESLAFPTVYWPEWKCRASFVTSNRLPPIPSETLYAVLVFVFYGDRVALADITDRGYCIPSGRIEPCEEPVAAVVREAFEETGARLAPEQVYPIGWYRLVSTENPEKPDRICPVFVTEANGFSEIPKGSESRGIVLAAVEDVADLYFTWDELMSAVFDYANHVRTDTFKPGISLSEFMTGD